MIDIIALSIGWIVTGLLAHGITYRYYQSTYGESTISALRETIESLDFEFSIAMLIFGPIGLFIAFFMSGFARKGVQWRRNR
jgi:hypothetical protein